MPLIPPPDLLETAFATTGTVETIGCSGTLRRRALADLFLPTGRIGIGYPGEGETGRLINTPSEIVPHVPPGKYPVFLSTALEGRYASFAFLTILFDSALPDTWKSAGGFFTDSGTGVVYDTSQTDALREHRKAASSERWSSIESESLGDGDGKLVLEPTSGANAILFHTHDYFYPAFTGHDGTGKIVCLVIDGRDPHNG